MKLFLSSNSLTTKTKNILMLYHAVRSAIENTDFEIFVIFDGKKEELNLPKEVNIIEHRHRCYDTFIKSGRDITTASSTFLRTEIPYLMNKLEIEDEWCLYTDYDVIFQKVTSKELEEFKPEYFAACPERNKNNWSYINAGVLIMNIHNLFNDDKMIVDFINDNFGKTQFPYGHYDQAILNHLYKDKFERLPLEYNWKPYWGINESAKIIHFHGPKPNLISDGINITEIKEIKKTNPRSFNYYSFLFEKYSDNLSLRGKSEEMMNLTKNSFIFEPPFKPISFEDLIKK